MDKIAIKDLLLRCTIGVGAEERREKEDVVINIMLGADLKRSQKSDLIEDTVDYRALKKRVVAMVEKSSYSLIETLAERIATVCLEAPGVLEVQVSVEKPGVLRFARSVGVEITRKANNHPTVEVFLGLGSNIQPQENIFKALVSLNEQVRILAISTFYETSPLGNINHPPFVNGVIKIETKMPAANLKYSSLRPIEEKLGRKRTEDKNAARTIDIDLLIYGDLVIKQDDLFIPDPEISERDFLAIPIAELAPDLILPGTKKHLREYAHSFENSKMSALTEYSTQLGKTIRALAKSNDTAG